MIIIMLVKQRVYIDDFGNMKKGIGGINTSTYIPQDIVAIYRVSILNKFFEYNNIVMNKICNIYFNRGNTLLEDFNYQCDDDEYDNLFVENNITECLMINNKDNWTKIRGGNIHTLILNTRFLLMSM